VLHSFFPSLRHQLKLFLLLFCLIQAGFIQAQTRIHRNLTPSHGLIQSQVISLHEDSRGYLWIGTFGGLSRWDGRQFRNFSHDDGMGHKEVQSIAEDANGVLYFATKGGGVSLWRNGQFSVLNQDDGLPNNVSRTVTSMPNGDIAVGTDDGVALIRDGKVITCTPDSGLLDILVVSIAATSDGSLYIATWGDGLLKAAGNPLKVVQRIPNLPVEKIRALAVGGNDEIYFVPAGAGIFELKNDTPSPLPADPAFEGREIITLHVSKDGTLLAGTQQHGAVFWNEGHADQLDKSNGLASNSVYAFCEGRNNLLFIGTWGGVSIYDHDRVIVLGKAAGLAEDIVISVNVSTMGQGLYFGFQNHGVQQYLKGQLTTVPGTENDVLHHVWAVHENSDGSHILGSDYGVHRLEAGRLSKLESTDQAELRSVQSLYPSSSGDLVVMDMHGLFNLTGNTLVPLHSEEAGINKATSVMELTADKYLLGTINGLFLLTDGNIERYLPLAELDDLTIWDLDLMSDGRILVGTNEKGLVIFDPATGHSVYLDMKSGLSDNTVLAIAQDADGVIYLSSNRGVNILHPRKNGWEIKYLDHRDGLGSNECVQGALAFSPEGYLWIGTIAGAARYDKNQDKAESQAPFLHIDKVSIFDQNIPLVEFQNQAGFSYQDNYLKIEFTGIHLLSPDDVSYRYRMSSVDQDWVQSGRQYVQYTNLDPGHYVFEISAVLPQGPNSPVQTLEFTISPPFWRTWWFLLLAALVIGGTISAIVLLRVRQLLALERLRTNIAADLHDDIGSGLTEISIISSLLPYKLPNDSQGLIASDVELIGDTTRRLITSMSDIVWLVNPGLASLFDLLAKLGESNAEMLASSGILFEDMNLDSLQKVQLPMEHRRQLLLIFKEAINNVIKYSGADRIRLEAHCRRNQLTIILDDNGIGFDPDDSVFRGGGNGLKNMRTRAAKIHGKVEFESSAGIGTKVIFRGPTH